MSKFISNYNQKGVINLNTISRMYIEPTKYLGNGEPEPAFALYAYDVLSGYNHEIYGPALLGFFKTEADAQKAMNDLAALA